MEFYSLSTGHIINRYSCTPLPIPQEVSNKLHTLIWNDPTGLSFSDCDGDRFNEDIENKLDDDDNNNTYELTKYQ